MILAKVQNQLEGQSDAIIITLSSSRLSLIKHRSRFPQAHLSNSVTALVRLWICSLRVNLRLGYTSPNSRARATASVRLWTCSLP